MLFVSFVSYLTLSTEHKAYQLHCTRPICTLKSDHVLYVGITATVFLGGIVPPEPNPSPRSLGER